MSLSPSWPCSSDLEFSVIFIGLTDGGSICIVLLNSRDDMLDEQDDEDIDIPDDDSVEDC
jgi:hypothetical protein